MKYLKTMFGCFFGLLSNTIFFNFHNFQLLRQNEQPLKKNAKSDSHWLVVITSETVNFDQSECTKINSHMEIYTKEWYQ